MGGACIQLSACAVKDSAIMQCFALALISFLLVYTVVAYPLLAHPSLESTSPRISCTFVHARRHCARFQLPIPRRMPPLSPLLKQLPNAIIGSGPLTSEEDHQIQRIMDVKEPISEGSEGTWLIPDVQVVLWFVVLCCFMEGIVSGFSW